MRALFIGVNVIGGLAVLGSYMHGIITHPESSGGVWGGVPAELKTWYVASMLLAALGYFAFTYYVYGLLDAARVRADGQLGSGTFVWLYAAMLLASALWMPLTFAMLATPSTGLWWTIRAVLFVVALASLGILIMVILAVPRPDGWARVLAIAGALAFCMQTVVLDAFIWPAYFPR